MKEVNFMNKRLKIIFTFALTLLMPMIFRMSVNAETLTIDNSNTYTVQEGAVYWESSENLGIGKNNIVCAENQYMNIMNDKYPIRITGYSIIESNGIITESCFDESKQVFHIPTISSNQEIMLHIQSEKYRLGWVDFSAVELDSQTQEEADKEKNIEKTAKILKEDIKDDSEKEKDSYIFADFSGSMYEFYEDVLNKLEETEGKKYVFAEDVAEFNPQKKRHEYNIGGATDIAKTLNTVKTGNDAHIYLLTDLGDNCGTSIITNEDFVGEVTIIYYYQYDELNENFFKELKEAYPNMQLTIK